MSCAMQPKKSRRKLKRNMTGQSSKVEVQLQKCIRGGKRKQWMVLDTHVFMERECVGIKSTQKWLHMLLAGTLHRSTFHHAISNFVNDCHDALQKLGAVAAASSQAHPAPLQDCNASHVKAKVGRAAIIQRDESDDEDLMQPVVQRKCKNREARGWATVSVRGMDIECYSGRGRQLLAPVDGQSLDRIVQHLFHRAGEELHQEREKKIQSFGELLTQSDAGKIAWRTNAQASSQCVGFWQIIYRNQRGALVRGRSGLSVPSASLAGTPWSADEALDAANMVLQKARSEWNRLDCSDAERYPDEYDQTS